MRPSFSLLCERFGPVLIGVAAGACVAVVHQLWLLSAPWKELLLDKAIDVLIGLLAGLLAVVAFLPALEEKTVIRKFKQWGYYRYVVSYLREAIWASGLGMLLCIAIIVFPDDWNLNARLNAAVSSFWWALIVYSIASAFRIVKLALKSLLAN